MCFICSYTLNASIHTIYVCRVGIELPKIEVRFSDLFVEAECEVVYGKPIPTLWNAIASKLSVSVLTSLALTCLVFLFSIPSEIDSFLIMVILTEILVFKARKEDKYLERC